MLSQTITLNLPVDMYRRLENRARETHRSVEAEVLDVLSVALPVAEELPPELEQALRHLRDLDDGALGQVAQQTMPPADAERLEALHFKRQSEGLTSAEQMTATQLVADYERYMLLRAQAAVLLKERGYDVATLVG